MLCWRDYVDDNQLSAATWARQREGAGRRVRVARAVVIRATQVWCFGSEQRPDPRNIGRAIAISEEAIMANAMLAFWQGVDQEPADELYRSQRHGGVAACAFKTVILDAEGDAARIKTDQPAVGYRDTVRVTRQVCQHSFWSGEGFLGVDDPVDFAQRLQESVEGRAITKFSMIAKEVQLPGFVQLGQTFQNETAVQSG